MDFVELLALKQNYEHEVIYAQAKVAVINDLISRFESKVEDTDCETVEETEPQISENY